MSRAIPHKWTEEQIEFVEKNIEGTPYRKMWKMINERFNLKLTFPQVEGFLQRNGFSNGRTGHFQKGMKPWNKDMKGLVIPGSEKGWFKKGQAPLNYREMGEERVDSKDGYVLVKVADKGTYNQRWRHKHVLEWEKHHGEVTDGHVVVLLDGNKLNASIDNLAMLSRAELLHMNNNNLFSDDPEVTKSGIALTKLQMEINDLLIRGRDKDKYNEYLKMAERKGLQEYTFIARIKRGLSFKDAVNKPLNYRPKQEEFK